MLSSGYEEIGSGGRTSGTTVSSGGFDYVAAGGAASATTVSKGGTLTVAGTASGATINAAALKW